MTPPAPIPAPDQTKHDLDDVPSLRGDRRKRTRTLLIAAGSVAVVLVVGGAVLLRRMDRLAQARIDAQWARLSRCMIGDPIAPQEDPATRFRASQLTAMSIPADQRADGSGVPWPIGCATHAHALAEALKDAGKAGKDGADLAAAAEALAKSLKNPGANPVIADLSEPVRSVWQQASVAKLGAGAANDVASAPAPARPMTADSLRTHEPLSKSFFGFQSLFEQVHPTTEMHFVVEDPKHADAPFLCTFTPSQGTCRKLPSSVAHKSGIRLLAGNDPGIAPLVFTGNRGATGIYRSDTGESIHEMYSYSGYAASDGSVAILGWDESKRELHLVRQSPGQPATVRVFRPSLEIGNFFYHTSLLWDQLLVRGSGKNGSPQLLAYPLVSTAADGVGVAQDVAVLRSAVGVGGADPDFRGCSADSTQVAYLEGGLSDLVLFLQNSRFSLPLSVPRNDGEMTCRKSELTRTVLERKAVSQVRCTPAECQVSSADGDKIFGTDAALAPRENLSTATDLDGKLLVVWAAGERGGLRMRLGPVQQIERLPDVVLYDDLVENGKPQGVSTLVEMRLMAREKFALLMLATSSGIHAVRITPDGSYTPVQVAWQR